MLQGEPLFTQGSRVNVGRRSGVPVSDSGRWWLVSGEVDPDGVVAGGASPGARHAYYQNHDHEAVASSISLTSLGSGSSAGGFGGGRLRCG